MKSITAKTMALVVTLALAAVSAACGARLSPAERAEAIGTSGAGDASSTAADGSSDAGSTTGAPTDQPAGETATTAAGGTATGGTTGATAGGSTCKPGSATSTGVSATEVKVGNVSQLSGLVPGFGQTGVNGVKAYFAYINSTGGVCGRKVTLVQGDDRFQAATNRSETDKLAGQVIAFAGSTSVVDDGGAPVLDQVGIADVSLATTPPRTASPNNFNPNPIDPTEGAGNGQDKVLRYLHDTRGITKGAIFYTDVATGVNQSKRYAIDFQHAGIDVVATYAVAPTATNFRSQAADMKQKGVEVVVTIAEINTISNLAQAYSQKLVTLAGSAAEGSVVGLIFHIPEEASANPAIATMVNWYKKVAPGADLDFFGLLGWVAGEMVTRAIADAGPDPTQAKVLAALKTYTNYKSEYVVPINPAGKKTPTCFLVAEVKGGKWVKTHPNGTGFACE
jgi:ABC-type branched-subunit amino acid transport system substrate-binding protein